MWNTFKYTLLFLVREKAVLIWALAFPLVLATLFNFMFSNLDAAYDLTPIPTAIVDDENYRDAEVFREVVSTLMEPGDNQLLDVHFVATRSEAEKLLEEATVQGFIILDANRTPTYYIGAQKSSISTEGINQTIVRNILDRYLQQNEAVLQIAQTNPMAFADTSLFDNLSEQKSYTEEISVTPNNPSEMVRYFYALLGFSSLMVATVSLTAITLTQASNSALGARRTVGGISKLATLAATLLASWLVSFCCLLIGFAFIRFVVGIDFGGREAACIFALLVASFMATTLGAFLGSLPGLKTAAKSGIMTGLTSFLSLFAGLYGPASQELADEMTRNAPLFQAINPVKQVADAFYSLYYYDSLEPFVSSLMTVLVIAVILFICAAFFMRRQRHASI